MKIKSIKMYRFKKNSIGCSSNFGGYGNLLTYFSSASWIRIRIQINYNARSESGCIKKFPIHNTACATRLICRWYIK
jgi:hypothetical protein